jgi:hypothetical protein
MNFILKKVIVIINGNSKIKSNRPFFYTKNSLVIVIGH